MSAWPEAAWIVKKIQKNFDFEDILNEYVRNLNSLNSRINSLNTIVLGFNEQLEQAEEQAELSASVIRAVSENGSPASTLGYSKGTLWLVLKE